MWAEHDAVMYKLCAKSWEHTQTPRKGCGCGAGRASVVEDRACADTICTNCSTVLDSTYFADLPYVIRHALQSQYQRQFHFNEQIAQYRNKGPRMPDDLFLLWTMEYSEGVESNVYPSPHKLTKSDIGRVSRSVKLTGDLREKYRSGKYKKNYRENLAMMAERWVQIKSRLINKEVALFTDDWCTQVRYFFHYLQSPFNQLIFNKPPPFGRHNWPSYPLTFVIAGEKLGYPQYAHMFTLNKSKAVLKKNCTIYWMLFRHLGWSPTPTMLKYAEFSSPPPEPAVIVLPAPDSVQ